MTTLEDWFEKETAVEAVGSGKEKGKETPKTKAVEKKVVCAGCVMIDGCNRDINSKDNDGILSCYVNKVSEKEKIKAEETKKAVAPAEPAESKPTGIKTIMLQPTQPTDVTTTPIPEKKGLDVKYGTPPESDDFEPPTQEELDALEKADEKETAEEESPTIIVKPPSAGEMRGVFYYDKSLACNVAICNPSFEVRKFLDNLKWGYQTWDKDNWTASFVKPDQLEALKNAMPKDKDKFKEVGWDEWSKGNW